MITSSTQGVRAVLSAVEKWYLSWCFANRRVERCCPLTSEFEPFVDIPWTLVDTRRAVATAAGATSAGGCFQAATGFGY
jgi:hypothetical protein